MTKFISPTEEPVHIALRNGHTTLVTREGTELAPQFHREAIARGCRLMGTGDEEPVNEASTEKPRGQLLADAIQAMLDGSNEGDFTSDGKPNLKALSDRVGFTVSREERDVAWQAATGQ